MGADKGAAAIAKVNDVSSAENVAAMPAAPGKCGIEERRATRRVSELDQLAARYYDRLMRFLRRRSRSAEDAADLAQDTFARLSAADISQIREPASFLFTTALNLLRDRARSAEARHATLAVPADEVQLVCPAPQAECVLDGEQRMRSLEAALRELSPKCRAVFVLFHFDELPQREIARRLRISVSMVEKYVRQAMSHCQRRLDQLSGDAQNKGGGA